MGTGLSSDLTNFMEEGSRAEEKPTQMPQLKEGLT